MVEAIKKVIEYEIGRQQAVYEMLTDGYSGNLEAYIRDYADDYTTEETEDGIVVTLEHSGERWLVTESLVTKDSDLHIYEVVNEDGETILKTTDEANAHNMTIEDDTLVYLEDGRIVEW